MSSFDVEGARRAGYTPAEIAGFMGQQFGLDVEAARKAGWKDDDIITELSSDKYRRPSAGLSQARAGQPAEQPTEPAEPPASGLSAEWGGFSEPVPTAPARQPGSSVLDRGPAESFEEAQRLKSQQAALTQRLEQQRGTGPQPTGTIRATPAGSSLDGLSERAGRAVLGATSSPRLAGAATAATDAALLVPEAAATGFKLAADITNLGTLGLAQPVADWLTETTRAVQAAKSDRFQEQQRDFQRLLADPEAGVLDVAAFMAANPRFAAEVAAPSVPSMLVGAAGARLGMALLGRGGAAAGAGATNALMNAGATFSDTSGDLGQKLAAAGAAGAGTALVGRLGGAEAALAAGRAPGVAGIAGVAAREGAQEAGESLAQSLGQGTAEGNFDPAQAAKQATVEGVAGGLIGGITAPLSPVRSAPARDPYIAAAAAGFRVDPPLATDTPADQRKKTEAVLDNVAAMYGIPSRVVQLLRNGAEGKPLSDLGPAYARGIQWLQERGLVPAEIAPEVMQALGHGPVMPLTEEAPPSKPSPAADAPAPAPSKVQAVSGIEDTLRAAGALPQGALAGAEDIEAPQAPPQNAEQPAADPVAESQAPAPSEPGGGGAAPTQAGGGPQPQPAAAPAPRLQNRNRSDAGYVQQMQSIAANPDPGRLGFSRDFASGAPVVLDAGSTPGAAYGRADYVTSSRGRRIPVRYAVVEASSLLPSNTADGSRIAEYEAGAPGRSRVVAGNGRAAGLVAGYGMGRADPYRAGLAEDAALHGIDAETLARFERPVLVREMRNEDVTADIGDESNVSGIAERSAPEVARDDARRIDLAALEFDESGGLTDAAMRRFIDSQPVSEQTALRDSRGNPTRQASDRLVSAVFAAAYENDALLALQAQATDPEARTVLAGLVAAAPSMVQLKGSTHDIRALVAEAAIAAVNARRRGIKLADMAAQADLDADPEILPVLEMFAKNIRSAKRIGDNLRTAATRASQEANRPAEDMFGEVPKRTRQQVLAESFDDDATSAQGMGEQAGAEPAASTPGGRGTEPDPARSIERAEGSGAGQGNAPAEEQAPALTAKAQRPARAKRAELIELRKRLSVLESLRACLTS